MEVFIRMPRPLESNVISVDPVPWLQHAVFAYTFVSYLATWVVGYLGNGQWVGSRKLKHIKMFCSGTEMPKENIMVAADISSNYYHFRI